MMLKPNGYKAPKNILVPYEIAMGLFFLLEEYFINQGNIQDIHPTARYRITNYLTLVESKLINEGRRSIFMQKRNQKDK